MKTYTVRYRKYSSDPNWFCMINCEVQAATEEMAVSLVRKKSGISHKHIIATEKE